MGQVDDPFEDTGDDGDEFSELEPEPDESDTAPTPIASEPEPDSGRHSAVALDEPQTELHEPEAVPTAAAHVSPSDAASAQTAIHLPLDDPYLAPTGYPIKADTQVRVCTGHRKATSTTTFRPRSGSSTRNSPGPTDSSRRS